MAARAAMQGEERWARRWMADWRGLRDSCQRFSNIISIIISDAATIICNISVGILIAGRAREKEGWGGAPRQSQRSDKQARWCDCCKTVGTLQQWEDEPLPRQSERLAKRAPCRQAQRVPPSVREGARCGRRVCKVCFVISANVCSRVCNSARSGH